MWRNGPTRGPLSSLRSVQDQNDWAALSELFRIGQWSSDSQKFSIDHTSVKKQEIKELAEKTNFTVEGIFSKFRTKIFVRDCHVVRESLIWAVNFTIYGPEKIRKKKFELGTVDFWKIAHLENCIDPNLRKFIFREICFQC